MQNDEVMDKGPITTTPEAGVPQRKPRVIVVDDDARLRSLVGNFLSKNGFQVSTAEDATQFNRLWIRERFDACILDVMLPGEDGLSILKRIRGDKDKTPVLMLTAKGDEIDRILGLELGADDYLPKPFNPRELLARLHAIMRRREPIELPGSPSMTDQVIHFGGFTLNLGTRKLMKGDKEIALTTGEFAVLKTFAEHPKVPLSRDKLMELARGRAYDVFDRSLDVQVSRLRKIIEPDPSNPRYLQTIWGLGYVFIPHDHDKKKS